MILFLLIDAIEGSEVDIGGCLVDVDVVVTSTKDAGNKGLV